MSKNSLTYCKKRDLYVYIEPAKSKMLYFTKYDHYKMWMETRNEPQIVCAALITENDYLLDLTNHFKLFAYYFYDNESIPWKKILESQDINKYGNDLKIYLQGSISQFERGAISQFKRGAISQFERGAISQFERTFDLQCCV
jgi:hypothetical protein